MDQRYAFVLRIWLTESPHPSPNPTHHAIGQKAGNLRGTLQPIHAAEPYHFNSLRQLNELIETVLIETVMHDPDATTSPPSK